MAERDRVEVQFDEADAVEVAIVGGDVAVTTSAGPVRVEADVLQGPPVDIEMDAGVLRVVHQPERITGLVIGPRAVVRVAVPEQVPVTVRTVSADVFVAGTTDPSVATVSGRITASGVSGGSSVRTVSGDIEVEAVTDRLDANSVSGSITVTAMGVTDVKARAVSGDVTIDLPTAAATTCTTISGDVTVGLAATAAFDLDVTTISGRLDTTFPWDFLESGRRRLRGRVGAGGPDIVIRTTSGDVAVLRREPADLPADVVAVAE